MHVRATVKAYKACALYQLRCVTLYLYASGDSSILWPRTEPEVWLFLQKKKTTKKKVFLEGLSELNGLSVFPRVKCGIKKTTTDILAGDRIHVGCWFMLPKAADPSARLKPGFTGPRDPQSSNMTR